MYVSMYVVHCRPDSDMVAEWVRYAGYWWWCIDWGAAWAYKAEPEYGRVDGPSVGRWAMWGLWWVWRRDYGWSLEMEDEVRSGH